MTRDIGKGIGKVMFYILAIAVIAWTTSLTYDLVSRLLPGDPITPFFALALFDGGALVWLLTFLKSAAGIPQRVVSIMAFAADLLGVIGCAMAELFLGGQMLATIPAGLGNYVVWGIGLFTAVNLVAIYTFHIVDPGELTEIRVRSLQDKVQDEALNQVEARVTEHARSLAGEIANRTYTDVLARLRLSPGPVIDGTATDAPAARTFESETTDAGNAGNQQANPTPASSRKPR